jgi:quercetin dioxygenase-like cupin family protein
MTFSRRDLSLLLPALAGVNARAQQTAAHPLLASKDYHSGQIPYIGDGKKKGRRFFYGMNRSGFNMEMHETVLGPGTETHPPHKHVHEEITVLVEGTVETFVEGKTERVEAGSVIYFGSNEMHSVRNAGEVACRYYVIELRGDEG